MALQKIGLVGATAVAALLALTPLGVSFEGPALQTALADSGDKGGDKGAGRSGGTDSADAGRAGGGGNSVAGTNPSGTEGNQGNKGTMGNAGGSFAGSMPGSGRVTTDDDDDDDTQISEKPKDVTPPVGNAFGHRDRQGVSKDETHARAANLLGNLNAAHASPQARANAAPNSMVGQIAAYETAMQQALALSNATQRDAAITAARQQLALAANKPLTADAIAQVDAMLGITGASPQLGAVR
jgi:hypothetical protein